MILYVGTEASTLLKIDSEKKSVIWTWNSKENRNILGLKRVDDILYLCTLSTLYKFCLKTKRVLNFKYFLENPELHHLLLKDDAIYLTATSKNEIYKLDLNFNNLEKILITPPTKLCRPMKKTNYNHINNIFYQNEKYYIDLNWFTRRQFSDSGVAVLDENFKEIERFKYGWESHAFQIIDGKRYCLCATSPKYEITHPKKSGLMVDGKFVFEHNLNIFCKYFIKVDDEFYLFGGQISEQKDRKNKNGIIFILDENYKLKKKLTFFNTGGFSGCTV